MKIRSGDKIEIRVERETAEQNAARRNNVAGEESSDIIPLDRQPDYLPRRIAPNKFLNFYDVGLVKNENGDFVDSSFQIVKPIRPGYTDIEMPTAADFITFQNTILAIPLADWKSKFKRVDKSDVEKYDLAVRMNGGDEILFSDDNEDWTDKGYRAENITAISLNNFGAFYKFDTDSGLDYKITAAPSYAAPAAALNIQKGADIFLMPPLARYWMTGTPDGTTERQYVLDDFWLTFRRSRYKESGFFRRDTPLDAPPEITDHAAIDDFIGFLKTLPNARCNSYNAVGVWRGETLDAFPLTGSGGSVGLFGGANYGFPNYGGILNAVIKADSGTFYVWQKNYGSSVKAQLFRKSPF